MQPQLALVVPSKFIHTHFLYITMHILVWALLYSSLLFFFLFLTHTYLYCSKSLRVKVKSHRRQVAWSCLYNEWLECQKLKVHFNLWSGADFHCFWLKIYRDWKKKRLMRRSVYICIYICIDINICMSFSIYMRSLEVKYHFKGSKIFLLLTGACN